MTQLSYLGTDVAHSYLYSRLYKRPLIYILLFSETEIYMPNVRIFTLIRLISSARLRSNDITCNFARISIFTVLEPLLDIMIAYLPLSRPAVKTVACYVQTTPPETSNVLSSTI